MLIFSPLMAITSLSIETWASGSTTVSPFTVTTLLRIKWRTSFRVPKPLFERTLSRRSLSFVNFMHASIAETAFSVSIFLLYSVPSDNCRQLLHFVLPERHQLLRFKRPGTCAKRKNPREHFGEISSRKFKVDVLNFSSAFLSRNTAQHCSCLRRAHLLH